MEANVIQRTVDYPDEWANGHHVMLESEELGTVRWDQVMGLFNAADRSSQVRWQSA